MAKLTIYTKDSVAGSLTARCEVEKWEFHDKAMGEQYVMFTLKSPVPVPFEVGDWCEFRGQIYTLNVEPSCTQKARPYTYGEAFTYESVKMSSPQDDLTRCMMLDVVLTSGEHSAAYGTNYTGSANFTLNCFETVFTYQGSTIYYAPVHALLDCILANLVRLYGEGAWYFYIDDSKCHSDDKILTFSNWTVAQALAEIHNTFKLDYTVRGRNIFVGDVSALDLPSGYEDVNGYVTDLDNDSPLFFGYGKGYIKPHSGSDSAVQGKSLFQIKKVSKNDQQIVTRLRAVGSTKNMPYRYYNTHYSLPQTMFVQNLQLPDTFVPYDRDEDYPDNENAEHCKVDGNEIRDGVYGETDGVPNVRHVLGRSNDAYIDKNDDAANCPEGIREAVARWDGSDSELPEIYPTIEEATYGELRANLVPDLDKRTGSNAYPNYGNDERIDEVLAVGDDCNIGSGVMTESEAFGMTKNTVAVNCETREVSLAGNTQGFDLWTIATTQESGDYILSYTTQEPQAFVTVNPAHYAGYDYRVSASVMLYVRIYQVPLDGSAESMLSQFTTSGSLTATSGSYGRSSSSGYSFTLPDFHNTEEEWSTSSLTVTKTSAIRAEIVFSIGDVITAGDNVSFGSFKFAFGVRGSDQTANVAPHAIWQPSSSALYYSSTPFHVMLKDLGMDLRAASSVDGGDIVLSMKSGQCAGREFVVKTASVERWPVTSSTADKEGWRLELERVNDDSIHAYFPSANSKILPGDQYVLLNIALPDAYIKAAESRLLVAATNHLADNCETKYTYQPSVDDLYLQRNIDFHASDLENSVFWRLYAGMKFPFYGIPREASDPLPVADITIESVTIKMGEKPTPQVDITLNDKLEQSTIQKLQTSVDRLYGSVFSLGGVTYSSSSAVGDATVYHFGSRHFLSKTDADTADGLITFAGGIDVQAVASLLKAYVGGTIGSSTFESGLNGTGWQVDSDGSSMELDSLTVRKTMKVFELLIQQVRATGGEIIVSPANGKIKAVRYVPQSTSYVVTIENGGSGTSSFGNMFKENDLVRCQRWDSSLETIRFYWVEVQDSVGDTITLNASDFAVDGGYFGPQVGDELVLMGNTADSDRQSAISISATASGSPRITVFDGIDTTSLDGCTRAVLGDLNGISDDTLTPSGYGLYSDNVFLKGKLAIADGNSYTEIGAGFIDLRNGVTGAGINLDGENSTITLKADKTTFQDSQGNDLAIFDDDGLQAYKVTCIDEDYAPRVVVDKDGMRMFYANGQVLKEEVFLFDQYGNVDGVETRYYNSDGTLKWAILGEGRFSQGQIETYWTTCQTYHLTTSQLVSYLNAIGHSSYPDFAQTTGAITNHNVSQFTDQSHGSYDGIWADGTVGANVAAADAPLYTGWKTSSLYADVSGSHYSRTFEYFDAGRASFTPLALKNETISSVKTVTVVFTPATSNSKGYILSYSYTQ